ncbi:MAG: redoxin domain-containing protein [Gammaproteobacteria bacterium]|nr:MAG: redoxin domain-containing protein [Gammaproteobacteria bacterium]
MGVNVAAITHDPVDQQMSFASASDIRYPLLSDQDVAHVNAYGIRNEEYAPGHAGYGIPHPGIIYFDSQQVVRLKFAIPGYRQRPPMAEVLNAIEALEAG